MPFTELFVVELVDHTQVIHVVELVEWLCTPARQTNGNVHDMSMKAWHSSHPLLPLRMYPFSSALFDPLDWIGA